ncbi:MAG TPA: adenylate/guanylate cyclase domain-containing protein [Solirubrobacteraceae bacterium]|nr:adenylate/guanylate cyclase domain-containing protein [Solirubrobacteraceae bacterium]
MSEGVGAAPVPASERRLVSVLFADLVGFTTLSEHRDPEEVRELLSRYFDRCRMLIERYGGTVEKFIGDAVMAVWGTPVAREDDAERAVRAALSLTAAITALGEEVGMPDLRLRAGVLTGNAAVELGAEAEGMVLGDTVNTASRLQSIAEPGTVLVDDVTRRASEAAIAYEDAGTHQVKGREQPVKAWTALRVVAGAGGARRSVGLEAPLAGRDAELAAIIEAGEESAHQGRAQLVALVGEAGAGKSRLLWEFFKYLDGIQESRYWHQGRCLSYGEGVAYWALAEMVRTRAGIDEEETGAAAREKLHAAVLEHVPDERERRLVEPRLAHLLRLDERPDADRADLFSGWRLFFERMAALQPVILAFEDLQWADSGLLDFIDYLLEWSADHPILVIALGRGELLDRRPAWEPIALGPLEPVAITQMLDGLAPGLPDELVTQISRRAEGIPLYVVETIRMLQDRGLLVQEGARYALTGDVSDLEVPETLHALVASRLDGLSAEERGLLQNASVLGQSFSVSAAADLSDRSPADVQALLDGLVAKQVLARDDDPRSPERGQYVFLQGLLRTVAYGTLARRTRKALHLAAARHLRESWPGELRDIAEVLASHYLEAIATEPEAADVPELRNSARETLTAAGQAAASLALGPEAERYLEQAAELADDDLERARLFEQAGSALARSGELERAERRLDEAAALVRGAGSPTGGSAAVALATLLRLGGHLAEAEAVLEPFRVDPETADDVVLRAEALAGLAACWLFGGRREAAGPVLEEALTTLEAMQAWRALTGALNARAAYLIYGGRRQEGRAVLQGASRLAEDHDLPYEGLRTSYNLAACLIEEHDFEGALAQLERGRALAQERGDRSWDERLRQQSLIPMMFSGRWREAMVLTPELMISYDEVARVASAHVLAQFAEARGDDELMDRCLTIAGQQEGSGYADLRCASLTVEARAELARGAAQAALARIQPVLDTPAIAGEVRTDAYVLCVESALVLGDETVIDELQGWCAARPPAEAPALLLASRERLLAEQAHQRGEGELAERHEQSAIDRLRAVGAQPLLARALLDRCRRREDPAAEAEAREIIGALGATRWLAALPSGDAVSA